MADFRALLAELGCQQVATYIQSGNAVFASIAPPPSLAGAIRTAIGRRHGFEPGVIVMS
jgi:uncharacterized protein (DUF1697 family)